MDPKTQKTRFDFITISLSTIYASSFGFKKLKKNSLTSCVEGIMDNNPRLSANNLGLLGKKAGLLKNIFLKKVAEMFGGFGYFL